MEIKPSKMVVQHGDTMRQDIVKYCKLVGGIPTPLKNMKVSWDDDIPNTVYIYIYMEK